MTGFTKASQAQREVTRMIRQRERLELSPYHIVNKVAADEHSHSGSLFGFLCSLEINCKTLPQWMAEILTKKRHVARMWGLYNTVGCVSPNWINELLKEDNQYANWTESEHYREGQYPENL